VGTTTVAVNVGVTLALKEKATILIDLRPDFGTAAFQLNTSSRASLVDLLDLPPDQIGGQQWHKLLVPHPSGLKLVASPQEVRRLVELPPPLIKLVLAAYKSMADFVLLDLPPGGSAANREALVQSDYVVLVTEPEPSAATAALVTLRLLDSMAIRGSMVGLVVVNRTRSASAVSVSDLATYLNVEVLTTIPPNPEAAFEATRQNIPLSLTRLDSALSLTFEQLAKQLTTSR
jgi:pilus assembly protein CpaE